MNDTPEEPSALSRRSPPPQALESSGEGHSHRGGSQGAACSHRSPIGALSQPALVLLLGIPTRRLQMEHPQEPTYLQASYLSGR